MSPMHFQNTECENMLTTVWVKNYVLISEHLLPQRLSSFPLSFRSVQAINFGAILNTCDFIPKWYLLYSTVIVRSCCRVSRRLFPVSLVSRSQPGVVCSCVLILAYHDAWVALSRPYPEGFGCRKVCQTASGKEPTARFRWSMHE